MNKVLLVCCLLIFALPSLTKAQVYDGIPWDSTVISFTTDTIHSFIKDTSSTPLWQIGHSRKSFFGIDTSGINLMMTDTVYHYPKNANNWFVIKFQYTTNQIIDFWHKYQTDTSHAGGIVEFSIDHGLTWDNIKGSCNKDSFPEMPGVHTTNLYNATDTLFTGEPSFTGSQPVLQYSRIQFFRGLPIRATGGSTPCYFSADSIYIRFRFVSDTTTDTLAGWEIDSVKIEQDKWEGAVSQVNKSHQLNVCPNPSIDGAFFFPSLNNKERYRIEVYNTMGERIMNMSYKESIQLNDYPKGLYFYKVTNGTEYYNGRLSFD